MKAPALSPHEQELQDMLLAQAHLSPQELREILEQRQLAWEMALAPLSGHLVEISRISHSLCLRSFPQETLRSSLPLEREGQGIAKPGHWGRDVVCLNPEDGRLLHWYRLPETWQPTLLLPSQGSPILGSPPPKQPWLAACNQSLDTRLSTTPDFHPCDLTLSPETQQLLVSQRKAGTVQIVSLLTGKSIATVPIRPPGSAKALNLTLDSQAQKVYLCDQSSAQLHMLDLGSLQVRSLQTGLGVLGNLVLAPNPRYLYLLVLKPSLRLVYFDLEDFEVVQELSLKGQAFSLISDAPTDLMHLSPDQAHLAVLTSLDEPTPLTPMVNIIRTASVKTIRRFALKDGCRPAALATGLPNPLQTVAARSLSDWLGSKVPAALIREASSPKPSAAQAALTQPTPTHSPSFAPPAEIGRQECLNQPAPHISLPLEAEQVLVEMLVQAFYQKYLKQLRMHPAEIRRLRQTAHELRLELENQAAVMAEIKDILGHYPLKTLITREALLQATTSPPQNAAPPVRKSHAPAPMAPPPPEPSPRVELLRLVPFLAKVPSELLQILAEKLHPVHLPAGEWILHAGEMGSALYFVAQGEVEVLNEETNQPLATLGAGDLFGEMALILSQPRSASVRTRSACELLQLERSDFKQVMLKFPALARELRSLAHQRKLLSYQAKRSRNQDILNRLKARMAVAKLRELSFLSGAENAFYDTLASILRPVAFLPDQVVFHQGEAGYSLYFISRGAVGVFLTDNPLPDYELSVGEVFGEMALLCNQPRNATVRTLSYCQFYELKQEAFAHVCQQFPAFSARIQQLVQERERVNQKHIRPRQKVPPEMSPTTSTGLPPAVALFYTSPLQEHILSLNQKLELEQSWGQELHLFQPFRLSWNQDTLLITDTGNDRILEINRQDHQLLREWGDHRLPLQQPRSAQKTEEGFYLIADEGNQRLIALTAAGELVWEYTTPHEILSPSYAEFTSSETILFADAALHRVQEIDRTGKLLWSYGSLLIAGSAAGELCEPMCARRLPDGNTLIADSGNDRLLWVSPTGDLLRVWQAPATGHFHQPVHCELLPTGQIWVCSGQSETGILLSAEGELLLQKSFTSF